jgi:MFS family permease
VTHPDRRPSYRALLGVPNLARALAGMQTARIAQAMVGLALVLFTLSRYHSPELAGFVTFAGIAPGLVVSPIAGALLDRHGRTRLIALDFVIAAGSLGLIGVLALVDVLPAWLLVVISALSSLTAPLSATGLRSLFPLMAPRHLWERVNAVDANGYVVATIVGPPVAAVLIGTVGGPFAILLIAAVFALSAAIVVGVPEPPAETVSTGNLLRDSWGGLVYAWRNRTIRGLGFAVTTLNIGGGITSIVIPLIVLDRLGLDQATVGFVFAVAGVTGVVSGLIAGRLDTRGRERTLIVVPMLGMAASTALMLIPGGLLPIVAAMALIGVLNGPLDVAMFTLRQRRTDPAWMGRAFAVSMSFNFAGFPLGAALGGFLGGRSIELALVVAVVTGLAGTLFAARMIPASASNAEPGL